MRRVLLPVYLGCCAFLGGLLAVGLSRLGVPPAQAQLAPRPGGSDLGVLGHRFEEVARQVAPAVVALEARKPPSRDGKNREESGSGVLIHVAGQRGVFVLTN